MGCLTVVFGFIVLAILAYIIDFFGGGFLGYLIAFLIVLVIYLWGHSADKEKNAKKRAEERELELIEAERKAAEEERLRREKNRERQRKYRAKKKAEKIAAKAEEKIADSDLSTVAFISDSTDSTDSSNTMAKILARDVENGTCSLQDVLDHYNALDVDELRMSMSSEEEDLFDFDKLEEMENDENDDYSSTGYYEGVGTTSDPNQVAPVDRDAFWDDQDMEDAMIMGYGPYGEDGFFGDDD